MGILTWMSPAVGPPSSHNRAPPGFRQVTQQIGMAPWGWRPHRKEGTTQLPTLLSSCLEEDTSPSRAGAQLLLLRGGGHPIFYRGLECRVGVWAPSSAPPQGLSAPSLPDLTGAGRWSGG